MHLPLEIGVDTGEEEPFKVSLKERVQIAVSGGILLQFCSRIFDFAQFSAFKSELALGFLSSVTVFVFAFVEICTVFGSDRHLSSIAARYG